MTDKEKNYWIDLAIQALIENEKNRIRIIQKPIRKRELTPDEISHYDFCEDMKAGCDETNTPWGGKLGE
jgi:hypothetical protein